jgi:DNA-binding transcriptional MerR regulator
LRGGLMAGKRKPTGELADASRVLKPHKFEQSVAVAFLRFCGSTQKDAAKAVGVSERTVQVWEASGFWEDAQREALDKWFKYSDEAALSAIHKALTSKSEYTRANMAQWYAERRIPQLAPPKIQMEHGTVEKPPPKAVVDEVTRAIDKLAGRLDRLALTEGKKSVDSESGPGGSEGS